MSPLPTPFFSEAQPFPLLVNSYSIADRDQHTQTDAQTERQTDRQRDRQTERRTDQHCLCSAQLPRCSKAALRGAGCATSNALPINAAAFLSLIKSKRNIVASSSSEVSPRKGLRLCIQSRIWKFFRRRVLDIGSEFKSVVSLTEGVGYQSRMHFRTHSDEGCRISVPNAFPKPLRRRVPDISAP